jgi:hypothetical protein
MKIKIDNTVVPPNESIVIDNSDIWDMDITLCKIIHPMLVRYKEKSTGYPSVFDSTEFTEDENKMRWNDTLDAMIYSFKEYPTHQMHLGDNDKDAKIKFGIDLFAEYFYNLWD